MSSSDEEYESSDSCTTEAMTELIAILYAHGWKARFAEDDGEAWDVFYLKLAGFLSAYFEGPEN